MKFVTFIENRYQEVRKDKRDLDKDEPSFLRDAEINALHGVLTATRKIATSVYWPFVLAKYFLVQLGLVTPPEPVLVQEFKQAEREREAKKIAATAAATAEQANAGNVVAMNHPLTTPPSSA